MENKTDSNWTTIRIRSSLKKEIEDHVEIHKSFGNASAFVAYVLNKELQK
jgi:Arc/MetJ-type ribon-helix-helix transcriptional regulator